MLLLLLLDDGTVAIWRVLAVVGFRFVGLIGLKSVDLNNKNLIVLLWFCPKIFMSPTVCNNSDTKTSQHAMFGIRFVK